MRPDRRRRARLLALCAVAVTMLMLLTQSASARVPLRGVQLHDLWSSTTSADMDRDLDLAREAGSNVVRIDIGWTNLQIDGPGGYSQDYVAKVDRFVNGANARGMKVVATLMGTPCWASSAPETLKQGCAGKWWDRGVTRYPPNDAADYGRVVNWMTARYGSKLAALEVWNEPNEYGSAFWVASDKAAAYATLLKAAYPAAKAGNASVPVIAGSLSTSDVPFLRQLYANGVKGYYDGLAIHPYAENRAPQDPWIDKYKQYTLQRGLQWVRETQLANGDSKPIWATEFGWSTCAPGSHRFCVGESQQGTYLRDAWAIMDTMPFVQLGTVYNMRNNGEDASALNDNFGVLRSDFSRKPGWTGLVSGLAGGTRPPGSPTTTRPSSSTAKSAPASPPPPRSAAATSPSPSPSTASVSTSAPKYRLSLKVRRRAGRTVVRGASSIKQGRVTVRLYRYSVRKRRFSGRVAYKAKARTDQAGRFETKVPTTLMRSYRLLAVAESGAARATAKVSRQVAR